MKEITRKHLDALLKAYFSDLDEKLFVCARDADEDSEQRRYFDCRTMISENANSLQAEVQRRIIDGFDHLGEPLKTEAKSDLGSGGGLSLVDNDEFEDFLSVTDIVSKAEPRYRNELHKLERRLAIVAGRFVDRSNNPVGPSSACQAISDGLHGLNLQHSEATITYQVLEQIVIPGLGGIYDELNRKLVEVGVLPAA